MSTVVTEVREEITERRGLNAAGAAAHPALANSLAAITGSNQQSAPQLLRVPRASVPPPMPEGRTQLTPAPVFDEDIELLEDSGLLTLVPENAGHINAEHIEELSARFLIDENAREVHPVAQTPSSDELALIDEIGSEHLAFVETQGEIRSQELPAPAPEAPRSRLITLHERALAEGIAQYSDGVPCHDLEGSGQVSTTLRVRAARREIHASPWRHVPVLLVFAAGVSAGTFFALKNTGSSTSPTALAAAAEPAVISEPVVLPLTDEPVLREIQVTPLPTSDHAPGNVASSDDEEPEVAAEVESASADEGAQMDAAETEPSPALAETPRTKARAGAKQSPSRPGGTQPVTGTADPGVLMLAAKPPCNIRIDGKDTGLVTPQRVLQLSPGKHKIVLINEEHGLRDSFMVSIQSGEKTRVIRDNTNKLR